MRKDSKQVSFSEYTDIYQKLSEANVLPYNSFLLFLLCITISSKYSTKKVIIRKITEVVLIPESSELYEDEKYLVGLFPTQDEVEIFIHKK